VSELRYLYDQKVPMRDGVRLSADVVLPRGGGPFPTILFRTPYESAAERFIQWGIWWAQRGYAAVSQDCRGKYESEGTFYAYLPDGPDTYDTLEWVARQPWCNGRIGTWGRSYGGLYQWLAAPLGSPYLTTMAPHVICDDYFRDYHYVGGAFQLTLSLAAAIVFTTSQATVQSGSAELFNNRRFIRQLPLIEMDVEAIGRPIPFWRDWLEHDRYDAYWRAISTLDKYERITVPIFQQCGWYDAYPGSTMRHWQAMTERGGSEVARRHQKVLMGPWSHAAPESSVMGELDFGPAAYVQVPEVERRWFDYWLRGIDDGFMEEPPISLFVMGADAWRHEHEWPLARTRWTPYYLHSGGRANSLFGDGTLSPEPPAGEPPDRFDYDPEAPVPSIGGNNSTATWTAKAEEPIIPGPVDQRPIERRDDVLVYTSAPLEHDLEVTGPLELVLYAASSARDTDFTAKLVDVYPSGYAMNLSEGIIRARYRADDANPELLERGEPTRYATRMYPTSNVFKRGHRIRVDLSSSSFPRFSRNLNTGESVATGTRIEVAHQTVLHSGEYPSHIVLPVIPPPE
jgi:putative CocE/NonD family hydrolase